MEYSDILERLEQFTEKYFDFHENGLNSVETAAIRHFYYEMMNNIKTYIIAQLQEEIEAARSVCHYLPNPKV